MDIAKVKAAVENVRTQIKAASDGILDDVKKKQDPQTIRQLSGLEDLGKAAGLLDKVVARLDKAVERTAAPEPKKAKEEKKK